MDGINLGGHMAPYEGNAGVGMTAPMQERLDTNSIVEKIFDKESILEDLKQMLRGYSYETIKETNRVGTEYYIKKWMNKRTEDQKPMMNELGISKIMIMLKPICSNEIKASKIKIELIHMKYIDFKKQLIDTLYLSHDTFEISPDDYTDIVNLISNFYHMILMSIEDGRILKLIVTNISEHHEYQGSTAPQQKQGFFDKFMNSWRK